MSKAVAMKGRGLMSLNDFLHNTKVIAGTICVGFFSFLADVFDAFIRFIPAEMPRITAFLTAILTLILIYNEIRKWWSRRGWSRFERTWQRINDERAMLRRERRELEALRQSIDADLAKAEPLD